MSIFAEIAAIAAATSDASAGSDGSASVFVLIAEMFVALSTVWGKLG